MHTRFEVPATGSAATQPPSEDEVRRRLDVILSAITDPLFEVDREGRCLAVHIDDESRLAFPVSEILGRSPAELLPAETAAACMEALADADREGRSRRRRICLQTPRGPVWRELSIARLGAVPGEQSRFVVIVRDITSYERSQAELRESHNLLRRVIDTVPVRVFWKDREGRYLGCNPAFARDAGRTSPDEVVGCTDYELSWSREAELYRGDDRWVVESGQSKLFYEERGSEATRPETWLRTSKAPLRDEAGQIIGVLGVYDDITERRHIERRLQLALEASQLVVWELELPAGHLRYDQQLAARIGLDPRDAPRTVEQWTALVHPDDRDGFLSASLAAAQPHAAPFDYEYRLVQGDRSTWVHTTSHTVKQDAEGRPTLVVGTSTNVNARRSSEEARRRSEERSRQLASMLRRMCDNVPDMIWAKDLERRYIFANKALCERLLSARDTDEPIGEDDLFFALRERARHPERADWHTFGELCMDSDAITLANGTPSVFEEYGNVKGQMLWLDVHKAPFHDERGAVIGTVGSARDISVRKEAEQAQKAAQAASDAANRAKSEFLTNMSHELRTPLNGVLGNIQLLQMTPVDERQRQYLADIALSGRTLLALINDILDLSKLEAQRVVPASERFNLRLALDHAALMHRSRASDKGVALEVQFSEDLPEVVVGDELRVKQVVSNLAGNAIKFTHEGRVSVRARVLDSTDEKVVVEITVADSGIGIAPGLREAIFQPFIQADSSITRRYGGTGLGLAISRRLVDLMAGQITVESTEGVGSVFRVVLPLALDAGPTETP